MGTNRERGSAVPQVDLQGADLRLRFKERKNWGREQD